MENMFSFAMTKEFLMNMNILAVLVSSAIFFAVGYLWYSMIFGDAWNSEMKKIGSKIDAKAKPDPMKMGIIFFCNFLIAFGMAFMNYHGGVISAMAGLKMGLAISFLLAFPIIGVGYTMEGKSLKLFLIDAGYAATGMILSSVICGAWR